MSVMNSSPSRVKPVHEDRRLEGEPVIGLEVHAQLLTNSKMFCSCSARYSDAPPNTHVCDVCLGMPGSLPVINRRAVEYTLATALALNCAPSVHSKFDRKNYPYPDIPKGYQISQYDSPLGLGGWLDYLADGEHLRCGIVRVHLEEDTGKSIHTVADGHEVSLIDYNRSGVPLMEIVSEPELRSPSAASAYFAALRQILLYLAVCDGKLQEGSMRADVNVSLRRPSGEFGTKVEIKNLNSFRAVERALRYEIERQRDVIAAGEEVIQETRGWSEKDEITVSQRTKEYAHDYRYFPEPDLPPLAVSRSWIEEIGARIPELPTRRVERFTTQYDLPLRIAQVLTEDKSLADLFEEAVRSEPNVEPRVIANWASGELLALLHDSSHSLSDVSITGPSLGELARLVESRELGRTAAKRVLEEMLVSDESPRTIVERENLWQITDPQVLEELVSRVLAESEKQVATYLAGKTQVLQALQGKVMGLSQTKADPERTREILERKLRSMK